MSTIISHADTDGNTEVSVASGSAEDGANATTQKGGFSKEKAAKIGVALLALGAIAFAAAVFGKNGAASGPNTLASSSATAKGLDVETTPSYVPTYMPTDIAALNTPAPSKSKSAKEPPIIPPKPAPISTPYPTGEATIQSTFTVSTETTGPPTTADRDPADEQGEDEEEVRA